MHPRARLAGLLWLPLVAPAASLAAQTADTAAARRDAPPVGVFTTHQASRGRAVFRRVCADCHAMSEFDGEKFLHRWGGGTAYALFYFLKTRMPDDNPGSLETGQYVAVIAYLLGRNGFPAGSEPLPADEERLRSVMLEVPEPK